VKADSTTTSPSDSTNLERNSPLAGKVAVVTGASSGIGEAIARELTRLGANVVMTDRNDGMNAIQFRFTDKPWHLKTPVIEGEYEQTITHSEGV
jgi:NADP-dependent 3-hydroxy acid dehydrogenase YdfG